MDKYRKISVISPGPIQHRKEFWVGLQAGRLISGEVYMWIKKKSFQNELIRNTLRLTKSVIKMRFLFNRGIEWSLRVFASTRALRLFLRARAVIKFVLRPASSLLQLANSTNSANSANSEHFINFALILLVGILECAYSPKFAIISRSNPQRILRNQLTRIRACEQSQKFFEHEQASTRLSFGRKSSKGKILRAIEKFYGHSIPALMVLFDTVNKSIKYFSSQLQQRKMRNTTICKA